MRAYSVVLGLAALVSCVNPDTLAGQDPVGKWMDKYGISIRKVFDGTKEEQNPAAVFYLRERTATDPEVTLIDAAIKVLETELLAGSSSSSLTIYPVLDYHRSSRAGEKVSKGGASVRSEFRPFGVGDAPPGSRAVFLPIAPTFILDYKMARDWVKTIDETKYGAQMFLTTLAKYGPGSPWRDRNHNYRGRYYVYGGADRYRFSKGTADTLVTVGYARLWLEWLAVVTDSGEYVQVVTELAARRRQSAEAVLPKQLSDASVGLNFYPDGVGHFGIGIDYANGRDASKRFRRREQTSIAFKIKF